jgi:hypothetical protein
VVEVIATVYTQAFIANPGVDIDLFAEVNGNLMEPPSVFKAAQSCYDAGGVLGCTNTVMYWLDIDAHPSLIGAPLTITLFAQSGLNGVGSSINASLSAKLVKK